MVKSKRRIEKSIESFDKLIEEHKKKIIDSGDKGDYLKSYWEDEIKNFEKQKEKARKKLEK